MNTTNTTGPPVTNTTNTTGPPVTNTTNTTGPPVTNTTNSSMPSNNLNFVPEPPINQSLLLNFSASPADGKVIISPKLENLELEYLIIGGNDTTNITLNAFDRSEPDNKATYETTVPGSWIYLESSLQSFSCSVLWENTEKTLGMVHFNKTAQRLRMLGVIPLASLTTDNVTPDQIKQMITIGEDCLVLSLTAPSGQVAIYKANQQWTSINLVIVPSTWAPQAASLDLMFAVSGHKLYKYAPQSSEYRQIFSFTPHNRYTILAFRDRVLVTGYSEVLVNNSMPAYERLSMTVWVLNTAGPAVTTVSTIAKNNIVDFHIGPGSDTVVFSSPQITKFGFSIRTQANPQSTEVIAKHVDWTQNNMVDLNWQQPVRYLQTLQHIDPLRQVDFNDFFLVVKNITYYNASNPQNKPFEVAYQFAGTRVLQLRARDLIGNATFNSSTNMTNSPEANRQLFGFVKIFVDWTRTDRLTLLNVYANPDGSYSVIAFEYGSLAANKQIIKPASSSYISFTEPTHDTMFSPRELFLWAYVKRSSNVTNVTVVVPDNSTASHTKTINYTIHGEWHILYENDMCKLIKEGAGFNSNFTLYRYNETAQDFTEVADLTPLIANLTTALDSTTEWQTSERCDRFRINQDVYARPHPNAPFMPVMVPDNVTFTAIDQNLTTAISKEGNVTRIFKVRPDGTVAPIFEPPVAFPAGSQIETLWDRIAVWATSSTSAFVLGLQASSTGMAMPFFNYSFNNFSATPQIQASRNLTKIVVMGPVNLNGTVKPKVDAYFFDYSSMTYRNITFPKEAIADANKTFLSVGEQFFYIRQLNTTSNTSALKQYVYYLSKDTVPLLVYSKDLSFPADTTWIKTLIIRNPAGKNFLFSEYTKGASAPLTRVVEVTEINGEQAELNSDTTSNIRAEMVNGQVKMCPPGCSDCACTSCLSSYVLSSSTSSCRPCPPGCLTCSASNTAVCQSCVTGSFLNSTNKCQPCDSTCISCSGSSSNCSVCPPGQFKGTTQCEACPKNCFNCSDANTCITCNKGFAVTNTSNCRGCSLGCSDCSATNITSCTGCSYGLQLINGKCQPCPSNCIKCSDNKCAVCTSNYQPNSNGVCVAACSVSCLTCADNQPNYCLSCQSGSAVVNGVCALDLSCNSNSSCTNCGIGLNYVLVFDGTGNICDLCPSISNCVQCDSVNNYQCAICKSGYYSDSVGACNQCHSNCTSCKSDSICTGCHRGYTLMDGFKEGPCIQCEHPCTACQGSAIYCIQCAQGYSRKGWKCRNNRYTGFVIILNDNEANVLANIDAIVAGLLQLMGMNSTDVQAITFEAITSGSTSLAGSTNTGSSAAFQQAATSGIPGTSYTASQVVGVSVTEYGTENTKKEQSSNVGLIVGLVVGLTLGLTVIIIIVVIVLKKKAVAGSQIEHQSGKDHIDILDKNKQRVHEESNFDFTNKQQAGSVPVETEKFQ